MPTEPVLNLDKVYVIISCITVFVAIACPLLTALVNNWYQLKLKKLELEDIARREDENHKQEIIEQYLLHAGKCLSEHYQEDFSSYAGYYGIAFQYAPKEVHGLMQALNTDILEADKASAIETFEELSLKLQASRTEKQK